MSYAPQVDGSLVHCKIVNSDLNWYNISREIKSAGSPKLVDLELESLDGERLVQSVSVTEVIIDFSSGSSSFIFDHNGQRLLGRIEACTGWIERL